MTIKPEAKRIVPRIGLNRTEVALAVGVSAGTIDLMVKEGALPQPRKWHSRKIWLVSEIEAAMNDWPEDGVSDGGEIADSDDWSMSV